MELDIPEISKCIERQTEPEPFSGVVYFSEGSEVLLEKGMAWQ